MRIAVLGCGSIGRRHIRNLFALGETNVIGFDPTESATAAARGEVGCIVTNTLDGIWRFGPEIVFVTAPTSHHIPMAIEAANRSCHLFLEKPLSHTLEGADQLLAAVEKRGLITMGACNMRFHPGPETVKRLLERNHIGRILSGRIHTGSYLPHWRPQSDFRQSYSASPIEGGAIRDCIHEIDLATWYLGDAEVAASVALPADSLKIDVDGLAEILLRHRSGALSSVHLNFVQRDYSRSCQILGTEGTLYWTFGQPFVRCARGTNEDESFPLPLQWQLNDMFVDEIRYFLGCVADERPACNDLKQMMRTLAIALEARKRATEAGFLRHHCEDSLPSERV